MRHSLTLNRMKTDWQPRVLDLHRFTMSNGVWQDATPLSQLARVHEACWDHTGVADRTCQWTLTGETRIVAGTVQAWLHLTAQVTLRLQCQRCLEPLDIPVQVDRWFRLVADEATALEEDDAAEEDLLALDREFDALALLEDDVLLAMPLVPRHTACQAPWSAALGDNLPHPFAALATLKEPKQ